MVGFTYEMLFNFNVIPLEGAKFHYDNKIFQVMFLDNVIKIALCREVNKKREPIFIE